MPDASHAEDTVEPQPDRALLELDLSRRATDRIDQLIPRLRAASRADVIRRALQLLDYLVDQEDQGATITVTSRDGRRRDRLVIR
ncbi:MAG TPA: hypothetical protein PKA64_21935, partial [Myxococcota bacterium]|nr:hypothetical protein [Myxococcota bacterium]